MQVITISVLLYCDIKVNKVVNSALEIMVNNLRLIFSLRAINVQFYVMCILYSPVSSTRASIRIHCAIQFAQRSDKAALQAYLPIPPHQAVLRLMRVCICRLHFTPPLHLHYTGGQKFDLKAIVYTDFDSSNNQRL